MKLNRKQVSLAVARALSAGAAVGLAAPMVYAQTPPATPPVQKIEKIGAIPIKRGGVAIEQFHVYKATKLLNPFP